MNNKKDLVNKIAEMMRFPSEGEVEIKQDGQRHYVELITNFIYPTRYYINYFDGDEKLLVGSKYPWNIFEECIPMASFVADGQPLPRISSERRISLKKNDL